MMKKLLSGILLVCLLVIASNGIASAQSGNQLQLGLTRDFGYGGIGDDIQGLFSMKIRNPPADITRVVFFIDTLQIGEDTQAPFSLQFNTDSYPLGIHTMSAVGYSSDGMQFTSNTIKAEFVPASAATGVLVKIVAPIIGLVLLMIILSFVLPLILNKGKLSSIPLGAPRKYGIGGGAVCPKCGRPFPLRLWFINLGFKKIDRCPYCGKWSFVSPRSISELRLAEAAELTASLPENPIPEESEADKLSKDMDDSKFQDL